MAGKSAADGGLSGQVRNPDFYCSRPACKNYAVKGTTVCRIHGAKRKVAARRVATAELAKAAGKVVLKPEEFPQAVMGIVAWHLGLVRDIQHELDDLSLIGTPIEVAREYADILDRVDKSSAALAKLMTSIAALDIADSFRKQANAMTEAQRADRVNRLRALTLEAEATVDMWRCPVCSRACCSAQVLDAEVADDVG